MSHGAFGQQVIEHEARALKNLAARLDESFEAAVELMLGCQGHVVVTGIGKARLVGQKVSATLASTGTPSFDLHAGEALHGDLGRVRPGDVALALSNSGRTREVVELIDPLKKLSVPLIAMTGKLDSPLAQGADLVLHIGELDEACPLKLAPSTTTTAMLALGDALALTVQKARNFTSEQYARFHPAGALGRKLMRVHEVMRTGDQAPIIRADESVGDAIIRTASSRAGAVSIVDAQGQLVGIFTNGDLRRKLAEDPQLTQRLIGDVMTRAPKRIAPDRLASEAFGRLKEFAIDELPVVDESGRPVGMIDVQDFLGWSR